MPNDQPTYSAKIGERIQRRRWHRKWNIADVLPRLKTPVDESTYDRWERGLEDIPVNMLPELAAALEFKTIKIMMPLVDTGISISQKGDRSMDLRTVILQVLADVSETHLESPLPKDVTDEVDLAMELGFDSVAYVAVISTLEDKLGYIPRSILEGASFPTTFGELVTAYERELDCS